MLEVLQFIFSDFWHWLGALIIVGAVLNGLAEIISAFRK